MTGTRCGTVAACLLIFASLAAALQTNGPVQYVYDELGRLLAAIDANGNAAVYSYDAVGNILLISRVGSTQTSIISFTPDQGPQGASVSIYGTGFSSTSSQDTVQFNGVAATVTSATGNQIVVTVPAGATSGPITITTPAGSATSAATFTVLSGGPPTITSFGPSGIGVAGTAVTITGTNFSSSPANNHLLFNAAPAKSTSASATSIGTAVPISGTSGHLTVATPLGSAVSAGDFFVPFGTHTAADVAYTGRTTVGGSATVALNVAPKIGLLLFDGTAGQRVNLQWTSTISSCTLYLFTPSGAQLASTSCGAGYLSGAIQNTLPATGSYTIGVDAPYYTGNVSIQITDISDVVGNISIDGPAVTTTTTKAYQDARLSFNGGFQKVFLQVTQVTNPSATVALQSATGETIASIPIGNSPAGSTFNMDTQTLLGTGAYTLRVQHSGTNVGSETLQLTSAPDVTGPITMDGAPVTTTTTKLGQDVRLTFSATAGQRVFVRANNVTNPYATLYLVKPDGTNQTYTTIANGSGTTYFIDTQTLPLTGVYTLWVHLDKSEGPVKEKLSLAMRQHRDVRQRS
jgi:YD repeat-containing protein